MPRAHADTHPDATTVTGSQWQKDHRQALLPSIGVPQRKLVRGQGCRVWDSDGNAYLDLLAGIAVNSLGHAHPELIKAVSSQMLTLGHISNYFASDPQIELASRLLELSQAQGGGVYFSNSGAEANEAAFKMARRIAGESNPKQVKIIAVEGAFHGRTMGALALTHKPAYREPFAPLPGHVVHVPFGDTGALLAEIDETTAAVFIETIQGEAGVRPHPAGYLVAARKATADVGALLILDEVQTGIGRTGHWFAYQDEDLGGGIIPDVLTLAKGLGGGFPLAATVALNARAAGLLKPGQHGSTYSGNPVGTAAGLAVLNTIARDGILEHVRTVGEHLNQMLQQQTGVSQVRGAGLLHAFELAGTSAAAFMNAALEHGFIVNAVAETWVRLAPPLIIEQRELTEFIAAFDAIYVQALAQTREPTTPQSRTTPLNNREDA